MKYKNLTIIGTSHIAKQSLDEVKKAIEEEKPEIVALELDKKRLYALMQAKKEKIRVYNIFKVGFKGFLFSLIGAWAEKKIGGVVDVQEPLPVLGHPVSRILWVREKPPAQFRVDCAEFSCIAIQLLVR